jgi:transcriptional regulator with XRE-family HTH domain
MASAAEVRKVQQLLGNRVAQHRKLAQLTQAQLAEAVGVVTETISRLERGAVIPPVSKLHQIAQAIGVELVDLFRFRDTNTGKDVAIERLVIAVSKRKQAEIEAVADIAERIFKEW